MMDLDEILGLLQSDLPGLCAKARETALVAKGTHVFVRGLIEFSNICRRNCLYCGLRAQNGSLKRYCLSQNDIIDAASIAVKSGVDSIVLQSGEGACDPAWLAEVVREIVMRFGVAVTLSVGECDRKDYELWRKNGASRYLLKHETADPALYDRLHPGYSLKDRLECLHVLGRLGYETGSGFMTGLPGQTLATLDEDIRLCAKLNVAMAGVGPFISQHNTPLAGNPSGSPDLALAAVATLRLALPHLNLPATTALASVDRDQGQLRGLMAGANVLMPSFTPPQAAEFYSIYDNKNRVGIEQAGAAITAAGRTHSLNI